MNPSGKRTRAEIDEMALEAVNASRRVEGLPPLARLPPTKRLRATTLVDAVSTADHEPDDGGDSEAVLVCECIEEIYFVNQKSGAVVEAKLTPDERA